MPQSRIEMIETIAQQQRVIDRLRADLADRNLQIERYRRAENERQREREIASDSIQNQHRSSQELAVQQQGETEYIEYQNDYCMDF